MMSRLPLLYSVANAECATRKHTSLVLLVAAYHLLLGAFRHALHEHIKSPSHIAAVGCSRQFVLESYHAVKTVYFTSSGTLSGITFEASVRDAPST